MATFLKEVNHSGSLGSHFKLAIYYDLLSQSVSTNSSTVRLYLKINKTSGYSASGVASNAYINGSWVGGTTNLPAGITTVNLGQRDIVVVHNSSGRGTLSYSASHSTNWSGVGSASLSGTKSLPTIPRQANITSASNRTDEENITFNYSNPAGNSTTTLEAMLRFTDGTTIKAYESVNKTGTSHTILLNNSLKNTIRSKFNDTTKGTIQIRLKTVLGGNTYYSDKNITINIINAEPELSGTFEMGSNDQLTYDLVVGGISTFGSGELSGGNITLFAVRAPIDTIIKGVSNVVAGERFNINLNTKKQATVKNYTFSNGGKNITVENAGYIGMGIVTDKTFTLTGTDSRGLQNTLGYTHSQFIDYDPPINTKFEAKRLTAISTETELEIDGTFFDDTFGAVQNTISIDYQYTELGQNDWSAYQSLTLAPCETTGCYKFKGQIHGDLGASGFSKDKTFTIRIRVKDEISEITKTVQLNSAQFNAVFYDNGDIAIGAPRDTAQFVLRNDNIMVRVDGNLIPLFVPKD